MRTDAHFHANDNVFPGREGVPPSANVRRLRSPGGGPNAVPPECSQGVVFGVAPSMYAATIFANLSGDSSGG